MVTVSTLDAMLPLNKKAATIQKRTAQLKLDDEGRQHHEQRKDGNKKALAAYAPGLYVIGFEGQSRLYGGCLGKESGIKLRL